MALEVLDTLGSRCPIPILRLALKAVHMSSDDVLEVWGDCPRLESDTRFWCERLGRVILAVRDVRGNGNKTRIWIGF